MGRMITKSSEFGTIKWKKAVQLNVEERVEFDSFNKRLNKLFFTVEGEGGSHSVILFSDSGKGSCDCMFSSNWGEGSMCSHELACHFWLCVNNSEVVL